MVKIIGMGMIIFLNYALYSMEEEIKEKPVMRKQLIGNSTNSKYCSSATPNQPFPYAVFKKCDDKLRLLKEIINTQDLLEFKEEFPSEYSAIQTRTNLVFADFYKPFTVKRNHNLSMSAYILNTTDDTVLKLLKEKHCKKLKKKFDAAWEKLNSTINPPKEIQEYACPLELYAELDKIFNEI